MNAGARKNLESVGAMPFKMQRGRAVATQPVMLHVTGALALWPKNVPGYVKHEDTPVAKIVQRLIALRISAIVDHDEILPLRRRRLCPRR